MVSKFGEKIRELRESNNMLLIADFFNVNKEEFLSQWLGEKIAYELKDEELASEALKVAEGELEYYKKTKKETNHV